MGKSLLTIAVGAVFLVQFLVTPAMLLLPIWVAVLVWRVRGAQLRGSGAHGIIS
jgi:hypothetical protein